LLDAESGEVVRTIDLPAAGEVSLLDWLLDETIYVWLFSEAGAGPVLVDLAGSEPRVITVLPELFGLDLVYPDEFSADTSVADESAGTYHIAFKLNTASDKATYLYHSESDQVEKLPVEGHTYLIFPDGDLEPLFLAEDEPTYTDEFDLVWVDEPEKGIQHLSVAGHTPRDYPILWPRMVPDGSKIAFASSQGVSLVSIPEGQLLGFWKLEGGGDPRPAVASPDSRFLVVSAQTQKEHECQEASEAHRPIAAMHGHPHDRLWTLFIPGKISAPTPNAGKRAGLGTALCSGHADGRQFRIYGGHGWGFPGCERTGHGPAWRGR
jgi:hypothetical protein